MRRWSKCDGRAENETCQSRFLDFFPFFFLNASGIKGIHTYNNEIFSIYQGKIEIVGF